MRKILLILLLVILFGSAGLYFWAKSKNPNVGQDGTTVIKTLFPIGREQELDVGSIEEPTGTDGVFVQGSDLTPSTTEVARPVSVGAIAGFFVNTITAKNQPPVDTVRYVGRDDGFVYEMDNTNIITQISNIKIPNIYEALFTEGGKSVLLRYLRENGETIATYYVPIPEPDKEGKRVQAQGTPLADNILSVTAFNGGKQIATLRDEGGQSIIRTSTPKGTGSQTFFSYPFKDWLLLSAEQTLFLQAKAHSTFQGMLIQLQRGSYRKIASGISGLTASVSPSGNFVLMSQSEGGSFSAFIVNQKTGKRNNLSVPILPEKCAWIESDNLICAVPQTVPSGNYPESWYSGEILFEDKLVRVVSTTGIIIEMNISFPYDATQLRYSTGTKLLYFIDKRSGFLLKTEVK